MSEAPAPVVIRRVKKVVGGGHHGGAWKVAFADFATAMMAFFLLMWLIAATTKEQRGAISQYFNNPSMMDGKATAPSPGMNGPGGASTSLIKLEAGTSVKPTTIKPQAVKLDPKDVQKQAKEQEKKRLESLMKDLQAAIEKSQALEPFKDQLLLDITPAGLRIQIVDKQNRPMFDLGGTTLKPYTTEILHELGKFIETVPNRISISGHTDDTKYASANGYTNWELSADRANAARRALLAGGLSEPKVAVVTGLSSSVLFDKANPQAPINRRISIIVMNKDAEAAATGQDLHEPELGALPEGAQAEGDEHPKIAQEAASEPAKPLAVGSVAREAPKPELAQTEAPAPTRPASALESAAADAGFAPVARGTTTASAH